MYQGNPRQHAGEARARSPRYAVFFFDVRRDLDLSAAEYLLADVVHHLSRARSRVPGWCYASRNYLAQTVGVSRRTIQSLVARLIAKGIIERHPSKSSLLRTTVVWSRAVGAVRRRQSR